MHAKAKKHKSAAIMYHMITDVLNKSAKKVFANGGKDKNERKQAIAERETIFKERRDIMMSTWKGKIRSRVFSTKSSIPGGFG